MSDMRGSREGVEPFLGDSQQPVLDGKNSLQGKLLGVKPLPRRSLLQMGLLGAVGFAAVGTNLDKVFVSPETTVPETKTSHKESSDATIDWAEVNSPQIAERFKNAESPDNPWELHLVNYKGLSTDLTVPSTATYRNELVVEFGATADGNNFAFLVKGKDEAIALLSLVNNKYVAEDTKGRAVEIKLNHNMITEIQNTFRDRGKIALLVVAHTETGVNPHNTEYPQVMDTKSADALGIQTLFPIPVEKADSDEEIPPRIESFNVAAESSNSGKLKDSYFIRVTYPDGIERYFSPYSMLDPARELNT